MSLFNSLGSNYSLQFAFWSLANLPRSPYSSCIYPDLARQLNEFIPGNVSFFYQGRQALSFILKSLRLRPQDTVLTQALTCSAVEQGIVSANLKAGFVDLAPNSISPSIKTLNQAINKYPHAKALLVQHLLGYPEDIQAIISWCKKHGLILIEDLAHSFSAVDSAGNFLGTLSKASFLSFGKDKLIDAVSGGASFTHNQLNPPHLSSPNIIQVISNLLYPITTLSIRSTYDFGLGKALHFFLRPTPLFKSSVAGTSSLQAFPASHAHLALFNLSRLTANINHRRQIAEHYFKSIKTNHLITLSQIQRGTCLRFPLKVPQRRALLALFYQNKFHFSDIWYQRPVDSGSISQTTSYLPGSCPQAEELTSNLINLPTHQAISLKQASHIAQLVNQHLNQ